MSTQFGYSDFDWKLEDSYYPLIVTSESNCLQLSKIVYKLCKLCPILPLYKKFYLKFQATDIVSSMMYLHLSVWLFLFVEVVGCFLSLFGWFGD